MISSMDGPDGKRPLNISNEVTFDASSLPISKPQLLGLNYAFGVMFDKEGIDYSRIKPKSLTIEYAFKSDRKGFSQPKELNGSLGQKNGSEDEFQEDKIEGASHEIVFNMAKLREFELSSIQEKALLDALFALLSEANVNPLDVDIVSISIEFDFKAEQ